MAQDEFSYYKNCSPTGVPTYYRAIIDPVTGMEGPREQINGSDYVSNVAGGSLGCSGGFGGQSPNRKGPTGGIGIALNPIYDYVIKIANNGSVSYKGCVIDGEQEVCEPITGILYKTLTGRPDVYSTDGIFRFYPSKLYGNELKSHVERMGFDLGLSRESVQKAVSFIPFRETALMYLEAMDIPVADPNNIFELLFKYSYHNSLSKHILNDTDYALAIGETVSKRKSNKAMDWGGIIGVAVDFFTGLFTAGTDEETRRELNEWGNAFANYMQVDFGDIRRETTERGPAAGLAWLLRLKETSWLDLKNYITALCANKGVPIPSGILQLQEAQLQLEDALREEIMTSGDLGTGDPTTAPYDPENTNNGGKPKEAGFSPIAIVLMLGLALMLFKK